MKTRSFLFQLKTRMLAAGLAMAAMGNLPMSAQPTEERIGRAGVKVNREPSAHREMVGRLTRYAVKPADRENFQTVLAVYVSHALEQEGNIQAEAYYDRSDRSVMWLIERWKNRSELEQFGRRAPATVVEALKRRALQANAEVYHVRDLEPLSKAEWRRTARPEDQPFVVMLFVDAQAGTQDEFQTTYHAAMPAFRGEPGIVTYQLSQLENDDTKFVTYEKFRSDAAFDFHLKFPAIKPVIDYLEAKSLRQPFQKGLHKLIQFAPLSGETGTM